MRVAEGAISPHSTHQVPDEAQFNLIYYKKGPDSCGYEYIITGIPPSLSDKPSINLFPIPAKKDVFLQTNKTIEDVAVNLYTSTGQRVWSNQGITISNLTTIPVTDLPARHIYS